jgi:hypothetical protein
MKNQRRGGEYSSRPSSSGGAQPARTVNRAARPVEGTHPTRVPAAGSVTVSSPTPPTPPRRSLRGRGAQGPDPTPLCSASAQRRDRCMDRAHAAAPHNSRAGVIATRGPPARRTVPTVGHKRGSISFAPSLSNPWAPV